MAVYVLAQFKIDDRARYQRYAARFAESLDGFDGRLIAADEDPTFIEAGSAVDKVVLIAFDDRQEFERWATSPIYQEISKDRIAATTGTVLLIHGTDQTPTRPS